MSDKLLRVDVLYAYQTTDISRYQPITKILLGIYGIWLTEHSKVMDAGSDTGIASIGFKASLGLTNMKIHCVDVNFGGEAQASFDPNLIFTQTSYTVLEGFSSESMDLIIFGNNISYELYYHPEIIDSLELIISRLSRAAIVLKKCGSIIVFTDYKYAPTFVIKKNEDGIFNPGTIDQLILYLNQTISGDFTDEQRNQFIENKAKKDYAIAMTITNALNSLLKA